MGADLGRAVPPAESGGGAAARVVVVGAGFAGLAAVREIARSGARVTLIDANVFSTFQPLLYQVATAGLASADVAYPLWSVSRRTGAEFRQGVLTGIDPGARTVRLADGTEVGYDYLVLATGVGAAFLGVEGAAEYSLSLYTHADAISLRDRLTGALAGRSQSAAAGNGHADLNVTVVGGGATGVEVAGTLAELRNIALPSVFPRLDRARVHVRLVEQARELLAPFHPRLRGYARRELERRGVEILMSTAISQVQQDKVTLADGRVLPSEITVWAAGVSGPDEPALGGLPRGRGGRVLVGPDLRAVGQQRVFAVGDLALNEQRPVAQLAQPAIQQGRHAGRQIRRAIAGKPGEPFRYKDKGIMATIGRRSAVVQLASGIRLRGLIAWLTWLGLHLVYLLGHRNRIAALVNLSWRYLTWRRGGGLILGDNPPGPPTATSGGSE